VVRIERAHLVRSMFRECFIGELRHSILQHGCCEVRVGTAINGPGVDARIIPSVPSVARGAEPPTPLPYSILTEEGISVAEGEIRADSPLPSEVQSSIEAYVGRLKESAFDNHRNSKPE
jgi:hypothetical protein